MNALSRCISLFILCSLMLLSSAMAQPRPEAFRPQLSGVSGHGPNDQFTDVRDFGAIGDGTADDTAAFTNAVNSISYRGTLFIPQGYFKLSSTITISKPISIVGIGTGSQVFQSADKTLFDLESVSGVTVKDLYLGSVAKQVGASLLRLSNSHRNHIENVTMIGGYYGLHLFGSLLNDVIDLRSGANIEKFFAPNSSNQFWVFAERDSQRKISSNANTFVNPVLEGGINGMVLQDLPDPTETASIRHGEGSLQILGGSIEGVAKVALTLDRMFLPTSITGTHFEVNGTDVIITNSANIRLASIASLGCSIGGCPNPPTSYGIRISGQYTRNIQITDSIVQQINIDPVVKRLQLQNITTDLQCTGTSGVVPGTPWDPSVVYVNVGLNCS